MTVECKPQHAYSDGVVIGGNLRECSIFNLSILLILDMEDRILKVSSFIMVTESFTVKNNTSKNITREKEKQSFLLVFRLDTPSSEWNNTC